MLPCLSIGVSLRLPCRRPNFVRMDTLPVAVSCRLLPYPAACGPVGGTFEDDIQVGEQVTRRSTIRDVQIKEGRTGLLCFVTVDHEIDSEGRRILNERQDIVYRGADKPGARKRSVPAPHGAHRRVVIPSAVLLFRYSALTFNGHRIHYDAPDVRAKEDYPGLVVHGPLQATLLCHLAQSIRVNPPKAFEFRSLSPLFDDGDFTLNAEEADNGLTLWTSYKTGPVDGSQGNVVKTATICASLFVPAILPISGYTTVR